MEGRREGLGLVEEVLKRSRNFEVKISLVNIEYFRVRDYGGGSCEKLGNVFFFLESCLSGKIWFCEN